MVSKANLAQPAFNSLSWDVPLNSNFDILTKCFGSVSYISVTTANVIMTTTQAQAMLVVVSGVMVADFSVFIPAGVTGTWVVNNVTTGNKILTMYVDNGAGAPAGAGVTLPSAYPVVIISDGTNIAFSYSSVIPGSIGTAQLADGSVTAIKLASNAVTTAKILDANVTTAKIVDANITTAKIADANVTPAKLSQPITRATAVNSTSGSTVDFSSIPSWVKRITFVLKGVGGSTLNLLLARIGDSGGYSSTGYLSRYNSFDGTPNGNSATNGFGLTNFSSGSETTGSFTITNISGNIWVCSGTLANNSPSGAISVFSGYKTLTGVLDRVQLVASTGTFSAGSVTIIYE